MIPPPPRSESLQLLKTVPHPFRSTIKTLLSSLGVIMCLVLGRSPPLAVNRTEPTTHDGKAVRLLLGSPPRQREENEEIPGDMGTASIK